MVLLLMMVGLLLKSVGHSKACTDIDENVTRIIIMIKTANVKYFCGYIVFYFKFFSSV